MSKIENIEKEIQSLTAAELTTFRKWFIEFDADVWDHQIERDGTSGQLADLAKKSLEDHKAGKSTEL